jgi:hypothetical protein
MRILCPSISNEIELPACAEVAAIRLLEFERTGEAAL